MWKRRSLMFVVGVGDVAFILLGFLLAFEIRFGWDVTAARLAPLAQVAPYVVGAGLVLLWLFDLYTVANREASELVSGVMVWALALLVLTMALSFFLRAFAFPRSVLVIATALHTILLSAWRISLQRMVSLFQSGKELLVVIGHGNQKHCLLLEKLGKLRPRYKISRVVNAAEAAKLSAQALHSAEAVCLDSTIPWPLKEDIVRRCLAQDKEVLLIPDFYDILLHDAEVDKLDDLPVFRLDRLSLSRGQALVKRAFDLVVATVASVIALPLVPFIAIAVKLSSPGPVLYVQKRVGLGGRPFDLYKFRTMVANAEENTGPVLAAEDDPRITKVGRFLRATRLDELPQLINVIKGDMSFVGPRPERPMFVEQLSETIPEYGYRLKVRPGITGLAQVQGKYDTDPADKLRYDLYYIRNYSPLLDLQLLLQTARVILRPQAAKGLPRARAAWPTADGERASLAKGLGESES